MQEKLKLFISYSHKDEEPYIEDFKNHISPLKDKDLIEEWYDRKILAGNNFQNQIDNNLEDADIICLFISPNFLSSTACKKEKDRAFELNNKKNTLVVPIILENCAWKDYNNLSRILAIPEDGQAISSFKNKNNAWLEVYNELKKLINSELKLRKLELNEKFKQELNSADMLTKAHSKKNTVKLNDIFIYPEVNLYDNNNKEDKTINFKKIIENIFDYPKIVISGEDLSGKTSLGNVLFNKYWDMGYIPVYINDKNNNYHGKIENKIKESFEKHYINKEINFENINKNRIIPIIDDFHYADKKEKIINNLSIFSKIIVIVDDIFSLNIKDKLLVSEFTNIRINEFKSSLRYKLVKKWFELDNKKGNNIYKDVDDSINLIDAILGKKIGRGIMPAYPFFLLSAIVTHETYTPLNKNNITSQGYCYQALIYFYLKKQNVKGNKIDSYINFLTELAYYFYENDKLEMSQREFNKFMNYYLDNFNLPVKKKNLLFNIREIVKIDSFGNYSFKYEYFYYFFVAKYLAENIENKKIENQIYNIIYNLHVNENAYIAIFLAHHSKQDKIIDEIIVNALILFDDFEPASLSKSEIDFFDSRADYIIEASLPSKDLSPEKERKELYDKKDKQEQYQNTQNNDISDSYLGKELRRAIKTVEVMGIIIKNRAGSLKRDKLKDVFKEGMNVHLRTLSYFLKLIEDDYEIIEFISQKIEKIDEEKSKDLSEKQLKEISSYIFWNTNFLVIYGVISKIIHSLGSDNLIEVVINVCDEIGTNTAFLVKHGILMWYDKNLQINELTNKTNDSNTSEITKRTIKLMVSNYCRFHPVDYRDRQRLEDRFNFQSKSFLYEKSV